MCFAAEKGVMTMADKLLTLRQVAAILNLTHPTIAAWVRKGHLPAAKMVRQWRVKKSDLDKMLETRRGNEGSSDQGR